MTTVVTAGGLAQDLRGYDEDFKIFIAGGITNCRDWQQDFIEKIGEYPDVVMFNPRREEYIPSNGPEAVDQISWEYQAMFHSDLVVFWFCKETLCPITLFELGKMLGQRKNVIVGSDLEYARLFDLNVQLRLEGYVGAFTDFDVFCNSVKGYIEDFQYELIYRRENHL